MIQFPCKCGYAFEVPMELAGSSIQCPDCGLLADVPNLVDIPHLNEDGTFGFTDTVLPLQPVTDIQLSFVNRTIDHSGKQKDLRRSIEDFKTVGLEEQIAPRPQPRYDPQTGELIRALQFKDEKPMPVISIGEIVDPSALDDEILEEPPQPVIAIPAGPVRSLAYATGEAQRQISLKSLPLELLMPANAIVLFFVFVIFILGFYTTAAIKSYVEHFPIEITWPFLLANLPMWFVVAHIGCVIESTGPDAMDELPRPLRDFSLGDDIFNPLFRTAIAAIICFLPTCLALIYLKPSNPAYLPLLLLISLLGVCLLPGVLLTSVAGTTVLNLSPDRLLGVIHFCGAEYFVSIILFVLAAVPSIYYLAGELLFRSPPSGLAVLNRPGVIFPAMAASVYLMHFFCWHLAIMYRAHHDEFLWLAQRHIKKTEEKNI